MKPDNGDNGKEFKIKINMETDKTIKDEMNKRLDLMRNEYVNMKLELLKKYAVYNVKYVTACEDALGTICPQ